jgi:hypothetical protein
MCRNIEVYICTFYTSHIFFSVLMHIYWLGTTGKIYNEQIYVRSKKYIHFSVTTNL